jgi:VWFA-related protein
MSCKEIRKKIYFLMRFTTIFLTAFTITGCGGSSGGSSESSPPPPPPPPSPPADINVSEALVLFGGVVLDHFSDRTISIQNTGSSNLDIGQIAQANPRSEPFSILDDICSGNQLAPSETCTFQIRFLPDTQDSFSDTFDIPSNDPDENPFTVTAGGDGRGLNVSINQVDTNTCKTVRLVISVTDRNDDPLTVLDQTHFSLFENKNLIDQNAITSFSNQVMSPLSVALALDNSGSIEDVLGDVNAAAVAFIDQLASNDEASIIKFATIVELMRAFTTDKGLLRDAIYEEYCCATNITLLYDAVWQAIEDTAGQADRRAIVVITDGEDRGSVKELTEVIDHARERRVPVFTIGLGNVITEILQQLADETGGQYFFAPTSKDLTDIYLQISQLLSNQYAIEYTSTSSGGTTIILDVEVDYKNLQGEDSRDVPGCL